MLGATNVKIPVSPGTGIQIQKRAIFDFKKLYQYVQSWFVSRKYDLFEKENTQKDVRYGTELTVKFLAEREVDDYVKHEFEVLMRIPDMDKITVETTEGKKKLDTGDFYVNIKATAIFDYRGFWKEGKFNRFLGCLYNNYIIRRKIDDKYLTNLYIEMMDFYNGVKAQLDLYR